jgi:protein disulfide-isomerase A6
MKPDWDKLASTFEGSTKVLIADVDCTGTGEPLCEKYGVQGFPTIKSFSPPDTEGEDYEGGRDFDSLKAHADSLGPGCSASTKENCSPEQLKELEEVMKMEPAKIEAELDELKTAMEKAKNDHDELLKSLQAQYEASEEGVTKLKKESAPRIKLLRAALAPATPADAPKDEV